MGDQGPLFGDILLQLGIVSSGQLEEALALQPLTGQRVGEALISLGHVTREQLQRALLESLGLSASDALNRPRLGELLVQLKHLREEALQEALVRQRRDGRRIGEILVELGHCTYRQIYEALALQQKNGAESPTAPKKRTNGALRVMVVDDSPLARAFVEEGLTSLGYEVLCYADPYEALEQVSKVSPNIVLSDLEMPGMDGSELCQRLKSGPGKAIPVVILTANDDEAVRVGGLRAGADDYVSKAASMDELAARIEGIVRRTGETERMRKLFARYTSDAVVEEILKRDDIVLTGEKREVTIVFADIRKFTSLAETLAPEQVMALLNAVLGKLSDAVLTCGGTLDKFLGDGLMALFGAPVRRPDDALRAVQAAQMMMQAAHELSQGGSGGLPFDAVKLGIGINTGYVVAGNLGSQLRTEYTCIGDEVNVASRLCSLAGPGEILIGQRTRELVGGDRIEALPPTQLKGKSQPVPIFRVLWGASPPEDPGASAQGS